MLISTWRSRSQKHFCENTHHFSKITKMKSDHFWKILKILVWEHQDAMFSESARQCSVFRFFCEVLHNFAKSFTSIPPPYEIFGLFPSTFGNYRKFLTIFRAHSKIVQTFFCWIRLAKITFSNISPKIWTTQNLQNEMFGIF